MRRTSWLLCASFLYLTGTMHNQSRVIGYKSIASSVLLLAEFCYPSSRVTVVHITDQLTDRPGDKISRLIYPYLFLGFSTSQSCLNDEKRPTKCAGTSGKNI